jgi:hypothetical protein
MSSNAPWCRFWAPLRRDRQDAEVADPTVLQRWFGAAAALLVVACSRPQGSAARANAVGDGAVAPTTPAEAGAAGAAAIAVPAEAGAAGAVAIAVDAGAGGACVHPAYQPTTCMVPLGELEGEAIRGWFAARGVKVAETYPGYDAHCREVSFGPGATPALVCTIDTFAPGPLGGNGPMAWHRDLRLLSVRNRQAFELLRLPIAFTEALHWGQETLFAASYTVDTAAGTVDLLATPEECARAREGVAKYHQGWADQIAGSGSVRRLSGASFEAEQVAARRAQAQLDLAHLDKICKAVGHYVPGRGGRLERAN